MFFLFVLPFPFPFLLLACVCAHANTAVHHMLYNAPLLNIWHHFTIQIRCRGGNVCSSPIQETDLG